MRTALACCLLFLAGAPASEAAQWFKTDTHVHSSAVSGDAPQDIGIISEVAKQEGFNAMFLTDHTAAATQPIGSVIANHLQLDDTLGAWSPDVFTSSSAAPKKVQSSFATAPTRTTSPSGMFLCELSPTPAPASVSSIALSGPNSTTAAMVGAPAPVNTGTQSLHLASTNSAYGESFVWAKRGPNLHSGPVTLKFSVNPAQVDSGSGLYVSVSIGGDSTIPGRPPTGYTPQNGTPDTGKHVVLVWQLGTPRMESGDPEARVITHQLSYMPGIWNNYTIDVTAALNEIPVAERPSDLDGLAMVKVAAAANNGTADAYFDTFGLETNPANDMTQQQEFVYRNQRIGEYDTPDMKIYPSEEMGYNRHVQRFNLGITDPAQMTVFTTGTAGIAATQQSGYPTQMDHPGLPGGASAPEAIGSQGGGADAIEAAERGESGLVKNAMIDVWDAILNQGAQILGAWSSDAHRPEKFGQATYLLSPSIGFDDLMRSYYEGTSYLGMWDFSGRAIFNLERADDQPYPARYPVLMSPSDALARLHFKIDSGITPGSHVIWTRNGVPVATDAVSGSSFDATRSFSLAGPWTYVRAELRDATDQRIAMSQPIFFRDMTDPLPEGMYMHVQGVTTPSGHDYTKLYTKGITSSSWQSVTQQLSLTLTDPAGSLVELRGRTTTRDPQQVSVDGAAVLAAGSRAAFDAATGSSWYFDQGSRELLLKVRQAAGTGTVTVGFGPTTDVTPPSKPKHLTASSVSASRVSLQWEASTGNPDGYTVYRDGVAVSEQAADDTTFTDTQLSPSTTYTYAVDAFDSAANHSPRSSGISVATDILRTVSVPPVADTYVSQSNANSKFGTSTSLRVDGSPVQRSFLRFDVAGIEGQLDRATLTVFANSSSPGHDARSVTNAWSEATMSYNTQPPVSPAIAGTSAGASAGTRSAVDVTSLVPGDGTYSFALDSADTTGVNLASRESANPPQLVIESTSKSNQAPASYDVALTTPQETQAAWTPDVSDRDGDPVTCAIVTPPTHGSATVATDCASGSYTPSPGYSGSDSFIYAATDSLGATSVPAAVDATVSSTSNQPPTAANVSLAANAGVATSWSPVVSDPEGAPVTCEIVTPPANGTATVAGDCATGGYTGPGNFFGADSFTYRAVDQAGTGSTPATVSVDVNGRPTADNRSLTVLAGQPGAWTPVASDADGDPVTCAIVDAPAQGTATIAANCTSATYTPASGYSGADSLTYRAIDDAGFGSAPATLTVRVNRRPSAGDVNLDASINQAAGWSPVAADPDGDPISCQIVTPPAYGTAQVAANCVSGTFTPGAGYVGLDSYTYLVTDDAGAVSSVATVSVNVGNTVFSDGLESGNSSAWTSVNGLTVQNAVSRSGSFAFRGDTTTGVTYARKTFGATYGTLSAKAAFRLERQSSTVTLLGLRTASGTTLVNLYVGSTGKLGLRNVFANTSKTSTTPVSLNAWHDLELRATVAGTAGSYDVLLDGVRVNDLAATNVNLGTTAFGSLQIGESSSALNYRVFYDVVVVVDATNRPPTAGNRSLTVLAGQAGAWSPAVSDPEGAAVTCAIATAPANGTATVANDCSTGMFTPAAGYAGADSFTYRATDAGGVQSTAGTVTVRVNRPPIAASATVTTAAGQIGSWTPGAADPDGDAVTCEIVAAPLHGAATVAGDCSTGEYTPGSGYDGPDAFTYRAVDDSGAGSSPAPVDVTVTPADLPPTAGDRSISANEGTAATWTPDVQEPESQPVTCEIVAAPAQGTATVSSDCSTGSYTSANGYRGADSFTYRATDPGGRASNAATVTVDVNGRPTAGNVNLTSPVAQAANWTPAAADPDGDPVTCEIVTPPGHGTATVAGNCSSGTFTPAAAYVGADSFTYRVTDDGGATSTAATVNVTIDGTLFYDGLESGNSSAWTAVSGLIVQNTVANSGSFAFRADTTTGVTYARKTLAGTYPSLGAKLFFRFERLSSMTTVTTLRTASGTTLATIFVTSGGKLGLRNQVLATSKTSTTSVSLNVWHELELRATVAAAAGSTEVFLDGVRVTDLSNSNVNLGSTPFGSVQVGESSSALNYRVFYDDIVVSQR